MLVKRCRGYYVWCGDKSWLLCFCENHGMHQWMVCRLQWSLLNIVRRRSTFKESWSRDRITKGTNIRSRDSLLIIPGPDRANPAAKDQIHTWSCEWIFKYLVLRVDIQMFTLDWRPLPTQNFQSFPTLNS